MESTPTYKAAVVGSTGAIGRRLISLLAKDERCSEIITVVRKPHEDWEDEEYKEKLNVVELKNMDVLSAK